MVPAQFITEGAAAARYLSGGGVGTAHSAMSSDIPGVPKNSKKASLNIA